MTDEEIRMQYRFTHHALVELYKLCRTLGNFKNGVEHNGIDEGEVYASGVFDRIESVLRSEHPPEQPAADSLHYLSAIRRRLEQLYDAATGDPRLREQLSDEVDWIDAQIEQPEKRGNRFCKADSCPYPDCLADGICPSQPAAAPEDEPSYGGKYGAQRRPLSAAARDELQKAAKQLATDPDKEPELPAARPMGQS